MRKEKWMKTSKVLALMLSAAMVITAIPATVRARVENTIAATGTASSTDGLVMNKTAQLQADGTYTIKLEAYATGTVTTTTQTTIAPTDFILVLDQSGSMAYEMSGIPTGYVAVNPTPGHTEVQKGGYYVESGNNYYRVYVTKHITSVTETIQDKKGNTYTQDQITNQWTDSMGRTYTTASYFVSSSLETYTRKHEGQYVKKFWYVNDVTGEEVAKPLVTNSAARARQNLVNAKCDTSYEAYEFHNDGITSDMPDDEQDKRYVAAIYTPVEVVKVETGTYTYSYIDGNGRTVTIGEYDENTTTPVTLYKLGDPKTGTRLDALKYAADAFVTNIRNNAVANNVDHRVAIVGFAGGSDSQVYYGNTELFIGVNEYNYAEGGRNSDFNKPGNLASDKYGEAYQSVKDVNGYKNLQDSIGELSANGATRAELGFELANGILAANESDHNKVIIFLTDGEPGNSGYNEAVAQLAINQAETAKTTHKATVYSVAAINADEVNSNMTNFLDRVSSNGTHTIATNAAELEGFFKTVENEVTSTEANVSLGQTAYMVDVMSDEFQLRADATVTCEIARHTGYKAFAAPTSAPATVNAEVVGKVVRVSGFNYTAPENLVTTVEGDGSITATGNKLIVTITGVEAKDSAVTGKFVSTNGSNSGIYDKATNGSYAMVKAFEQPLFQLTEQSFVLDYAKKAELNVQNIGTPEKVDDASDLVLNKVSTTEQTAKFGKASVEGGKLSYEPKTMEWNGYDSFYVLGNKTSSYEWAKVNVIPATSVYYEDDFATSETDGVVGIVYSGDWTVDGTPSGNTEDANSPVQGWIDTLADDTTYSDGSAHKGGVDATATFTFTGTGVDVYSRTDMTTGTVLVTLKGTDEFGTAVSKILIVDNKAADGTYYQIPTLFFNDLAYGTYTVTIKVTSAAKDRTTYYLDGIRVYNPLSPNTSDSVVDDAYASQDASVSAEFYSLRDFILNPLNKEDATGVYFVDEVNEGDTEGQNTSTLSKYEDVGPKNEVYLAPGQSVVFCAYADYIYVGLKAPKGETTVAFTAAEGAETTTISSPADLYYKVVPDEKSGYVTIKNTGNDILSITKFIPVLTLFGDSSSMFGLASMSAEDAVAYANAFAALPCSEYTANVVTEEEVVEDVQDFEAVVPEEDQNTGDVEVDNGETEVDTPVLDWVKSIIEKLRGWFN